MSILIVAPRQPDLPSIDSEVAAIIRCFHRPLLVQGYVTEAEIQRALTPDIEAFWFAGHASIDGLLLSGCVLSPQALAQYLSSASVEWSFLNSCASGQFVERLQAGYAHDCYAYIADITDIAAWRTAHLVALNYSNVGNILQAVRSAAPAGTTPLRYFPSPVGDGRRMSQRDLESVQELSEQIAELTRVLTGDNRYRQSGLIESVQLLKTQLALIMEEQAKQRTWLLLNSALMVTILLVELWLRAGGQ